MFAPLCCCLHLVLSQLLVAPLFLYHPTGLGNAPCPQGGNRDIAVTRIPRKSHQEQDLTIAPTLPMVTLQWSSYDGSPEWLLER